MVSEDFDICKFCKSYPPSSGDGKACCVCAASGRKTETNADRIRAMSDEELAVVIMCPHEIDPALCAGKSCISCCLDWLQQPVEEGGHACKNDM